MHKSTNDLHSNTGKFSTSNDTHQHTQDPINLKDGRLNYPEQTEMDTDEVRMEQNQTISQNNKGSISIRLLVWHSLLYTVLFTTLFMLLFYT